MPRSEPLREIHVAQIHEAVKLSVPYDLMYIVSGFYNEYGRISLNIQPDTSESDNCGDHLTNQTKFMSIERVFTLLDTLTKNLPDREIIAQRLVGHLAGRSKISYETLEEAAASVFANGFVKK